MNRIDLSFEEKVSVLFTGPFMFIGLLFTVVSLFFLLMMDGLPNIGSLFFEVMTPIETTGEVVGAGETNTTINGSKVLYVDYVFYTDSQENTATLKTKSRNFKKGDAITVEYLPDFFMISRIKGGKINYMNYMFHLVLIILTANGLFYIFKSYNRQKRVVYVLQNFELAKAILKEKKMTSIRVGNSRVNEIIYNYNPLKSILTYSFKTLKPDFFDEIELLAYAEREPNKSVILKRLPDSVAKRVIASV